MGRTCASPHAPMWRTRAVLHALQHTSQSQYTIALQVLQYPCLGPDIAKTGRQRRGNKRHLAKTYPSCQSVCRCAAEEGMWSHTHLTSLCALLRAQAVKQQPWGGTRCPASVLSSVGFFAIRYLHDSCCMWFDHLFYLIMMQASGPELASPLTRCPCGVRRSSCGHTTRTTTSVPC